MIQKTLRVQAPESLGRFGLAAPAFAFVGSGCLLMLEIAAARLIAPTVGTSLYTWTSVIGVVLGGISLGNYLGGKLADARPSRSTLALVYLAASASSLLVLGMLQVVGSIELPESAPALLQVLWITAVLFLLPSTILGMPTPLLTRLSLHAVEEGGRVVGRIQAAAALGSIACTFLTGFFLISWVGTRDIVAGVAAILLLLAVLARPPWLRARAYPLVGLFVAGIVAAGWASHSDCTRESNYYCIRIVPGTEHFTTVQGRRIAYRPTIQSLYLDRQNQAIVNLADPAQLLPGYEQLYAKVLEPLDPRGSRLDSFFLGGGGYVFPRWVLAHYIGRITVAEIDPEVTEVAREDLGLKPSPRMTILSEDGRKALRSVPAFEKFDAVFADAFSPDEVPFQLATRQFDELVAAHLEPDGLYLLNVIDGVRYEFLRSDIRTLRQIFPYVGLLSASGFWPPRGATHTYVIVAAKTPPRRPLPVVSTQSLETFMTHGHSVVLTDDYAPVDQLLAPVFSQSLHTQR